MDPNVLAQLIELRDAVQDAHLKRAWEAEALKAAQLVYETKAQLLMEGAPQFFRDFADHWEGMRAFNDGPRCGIFVEDFTFAIFRLDPHVWYKAEGAIDDHRALEVKQLDLTFGLPNLLVDCLGRHYRKRNLVTDGEP